MKKLILVNLFLLLLLFAYAHAVKAQGYRAKTATKIYDSLISHQIEYPKTVLAIVLYETGWMQCKSCALEHNNLFGFRTNKEFLKFTTMSESIKYLKRWQTRYYAPWKQKHPEGTYYEYLRYIGYCDNMDSYIKNIKSIEQWISMNTEIVK